MLTVLIRGLDEAYDKASWHGTNLKGSLRSVTVEEAAWRPSPERHNIWEIAVHAAYWKYAVWRRLTGAKRGSFLLKGSNWFSRPVEATAQAWKSDKALLEQEHQRLRRAVSAFDAERWTDAGDGGQARRERLVRGVAAHDLYHAGQIQLLKRLARTHRLTG